MVVQWYRRGPGFDPDISSRGDCYLGAMSNLVSFVYEGLRRHLGRMRADFAFRQRHPDAIVAEGVLLSGTDRISAGKCLFLDYRAYLTTGTLNNRRGYIRMGDNVEIGPYAVLWGAGGITIGSNVHIGAHVSITAHEARQVDPARTEVFEPLDFDFAPVVIEDHVLVCSGAKIVPGVTIGHHAMIGGGAVVVSDIPPYALAVGCPARVIRMSRSDSGDLNGAALIGI